jgi:hypothetical protein
MREHRMRLITAWSFKVMVDEHQLAAASLLSWWVAALLGWLAWAPRARSACAQAGLGRRPPAGSLVAPSALHPGKPLFAPTAPRPFIPRFMHIAAAALGCEDFMHVAALT